MTEVPEHLLQRSRDRRAALGLGGGDAGAAATPAPAPAASGSAVEPAAAATPAPAAAATPAEVAPPAPEPVPHYIEAHQRRKKIPVWAVPVIAALPFWGVIYIGTLEAPPAELTGPVAEGAEIYVRACASCHGGGGGGGVGRQLNNGEVLLTFPNWEDQVAFVEQGTAGFLGEVYGDPDRPGGAHVGGSAGVMAAQGLEYGGALSREEILAVVAYERVTHGGELAEESELIAFIEEGEAEGAAGE
ncbi:MAG TPA: c-type cytochrome [Acidimicrobiales bacterium]|nr:c-type cytochrome [Acidimicrobiales bacterium]